MSDIHFRRENSETDFDVDADLRNELERDLRRCCTSPATGVLITGDIAFSGKESEFNIAREWLRRLTDQLGCSEANVWTTPGNHDVDRSIIDESPASLKLHEELRDLRDEDLNRRLRRALGDPIESEALFLPLAAYRTFAFGFGCDIQPAKLYWEDDLGLNDGSVLRLRGLTSVIASDRHDNIDAARLFLTDFQPTLRREDGVEYLTLCHHPFDWLNDADRARDRLDRAKIRLFGHKHRQRIREENGGIFLVAGATHPERGKEWEPRYNIIQVSVHVGEGGQRMLNVFINARVWDDSEGLFKPDVDREGRQIREHSFALAGWTRTDRITRVEMEAPVTEPPTPATLCASPGGSFKHVERPERVLVYRLVSLPRQRQQQIALSLGLVGENEWFKEESALWRALLGRAKESQKLAALWSEIDTAIGDGRFEGYENPFSTSTKAGT